MNTDALKSYKLWIALLAAIGGVLLTQGVLVEGSTAAAIVGWILQVLGFGSSGAQLAAPKTDPVTDPPA